MNLAQRFWNKVQVVGLDECWEWTAGLHSSGYGWFGVSGHAKRSHRIAYELTHGLIPHGLKVCHSCDNRKCCNPCHLFCGTNQDNMDDMKAKERQASKLSSIKAQAILLDTRELKIISREYGISKAQVSRIRRGKSWKSVSFLV